jgi:hypothetical protein
MQNTDTNAEFEPVLRFRPGGPAITGTWSKPEVADHKLVEWIGLHSRCGTVLMFHGGDKAASRVPGTLNSERAK